MLEVDDILPSPLTPLVLAPNVPKPVCANANTCPLYDGAIFPAATGLPTTSDANTAYTTPAGTLTALCINFSLSHPPTTNPRQPTTTLVLTPQLGDAHGQQHTKYIPFAPHLYRLHNACSSHSEPFTRPTALIFSWKA